MKTDEWKKLSYGKVVRMILPNVISVEMTPVTCVEGIPYGICTSEWLPAKVDGVDAVRVFHAPEGCELLDTDLGTDTRKG
jgi:hypothetical protein